MQHLRALHRRRLRSSLVLMDYLSTQFLPVQVKQAYDHIEKGMRYDG